jgi:hypothetical protein
LTKFLEDLKLDIENIKKNDGYLGEEYIKEYEAKRTVFDDMKETF